MDPVPDAGVGDGSRLRGKACLCESTVNPLDTKARGLREEAAAARLSHAVGDPREIRGLRRSRVPRRGDRQSRQMREISLRKASTIRSILLQAKLAWLARANRCRSHANCL